MTRSPTSGASLPAPLKTTIKCTHTFRFFANAATSAVNITVADVLGALGVVGYIANNSVASWNSSFKINQLAIWPAGDAAASGPKTALVTWNAGTSFQIEDEVMDETIPQGVSLSKCLVFSPPAKSLAGFWVNSGAAADILMNITVPVGSILDLSVQYTNSNEFLGVGVSVASGVIGTVYYLALDGPVSNKLRPIGLPTTA